MAITTRYAVNMALQYNEVTLDDFLINPSVGSRRFLTEAEQTRLLRATETSALYFLTDVSGAGRSARYRWYDSGGTLLNEYFLPLSSAGVHNSIPIDWTSFYVPSGSVRMTVAIVGTANGFSNGQFTEGSGDLFTSWTLTQPSRTNLTIRSQEFDNVAWTKYSATITANTTLAPDNTLTADSLTETATTATHAITPASTIATTIGATYTFSISLKKGLRNYALLFFANSAKGCYFDLNNGLVLASVGSIVSARMVLENNGFYRCIVTATATLTLESCQVYASANGTSASYAGSTASPALYLWGHQMETGAAASPYIPTTSAAVTTSVGEFLQDTTGGPDGSRCLRIWSSIAGTPTLSQAVSLTSGLNYTIRFKAKIDDVYGSDVINIVVGAVGLADIDITEEWAWYSITYTAIATASTSVYFTYINDSMYGFASIDDVSISLTSPSELSEVRTYLLDDECTSYEYELNWLNKLGGRDTWVFTGYPVEQVEVKRNNEIEYSRRTNLTAPNRIYAYRENKSRKTLTVVHRCKTRATADWLKSELIDSIDVLIKVGTTYYPANVQGASAIVFNPFTQDYVVRVSLQYAFDINVQTR